MRLKIITNAEDNFRGNNEILKILSIANALHYKFDALWL